MWVVNRVGICATAASGLGYINTKAALLCAISARYGYARSEILPAVLLGSERAATIFPNVGTQRHIPEDLSLYVTVTLGLL